MARAFEKQVDMSRDITFCPFDGYRFILDETRCACCGEKRSNIHISNSETRPPPWIKVLYKKQQYEDNYTNCRTFLREMKKNVNVVAYSYFQLMTNSLVVMQQFSVILILVTVFFLMANHRISLYYLNLSSLGATTYGFIAYAYVSRLYQQRGIMLFFEYSVSFAGYVFGLYISSPLLCSLTDMISDGTISVLSTFFLIVHLIFQDYAYLTYTSSASDEQQQPSGEDTRIIERNSLEVHSKNLLPDQHNLANSCLSLRTSTYQTFKRSDLPNKSNNAPSFLKYHAPVSLNAATLASLMLASRLRTHIESFSILALSIILFALIPIFTHHMRQYCNHGKIAIPIFLSVLATFLCYMLSSTLTLIFLAIGIFTIFISPLCIKWMQHYKNEIHGPWDEAIPGT